jgi:pimeloyl-ACP methyl ester carboxylesterase
MTSASAAINGIDIHYERHGEGAPLLLLHGFTGYGRDWRHVFADAIDGYTSIQPDLRGHGRTLNPGGEFTFRQVALDTFALLDHLGIDTVKAIGMSLGANTLLHMATQQPKRVEAMVLVSTTPYFPPEARAIMGHFSFEGLPEEERAVQRERHTGGDEQIASLFAIARGFKDSYSDMNFTPPYLSTIRARTLIVHGDRDPLYPVELALQMYRAIPASQLWVVPGGGHGPIFGPHAAAFAATSVAFLNGPGCYP